MSIPGNIITNTNNEIIEPIDSMIIYEHEEKDGKKYALTLNLVGTTPAHLKGWELVKKRDLVMVGVSMGNGFFNKSRLEIILTGMATYFSELVVLIPDMPALHTYRAIGYDEPTVISKVKKHRRTTIKCCKSIFKQKNEVFRKDNVRILTWDKVLALGNDYQMAYQRAIETYHHHLGFKQAIERNTERYILPRLEQQNIQQLGGMDIVIKEVIYYLLEEMAFHEIFHLILGKESISCYYKELELAPNYLSGNYGNLPNHSAGWIVYNIYEKV